MAATAAAKAADKALRRMLEGDFMGSGRLQDALGSYGFGVIIAAPRLPRVGPPGKPAADF